MVSAIRAGPGSVRPAEERLASASAQAAVAGAQRFLCLPGTAAGAMVPIASSSFARFGSASTAQLVAVQCFSTGVESTVPFSASSRIGEPPRAQRIGEPPRLLSGDADALTSSVASKPSVPTASRRHALVFCRDSLDSLCSPSGHNNGDSHRFEGADWQIRCTKPTRPPDSRRRRPLRGNGRSGTDAGVRARF